VCINSPSRITPCVPRKHESASIDPSGFIHLLYLVQVRALALRGHVVAMHETQRSRVDAIAHQAAYEPFVPDIANHAVEFGKPVLMLNGDSHVYLSDNPLSASDRLDDMHSGLRRAELSPHRRPRRHITT